MELFKHSDFDFLGKKWPFIILSLVLTAAGLISLAVKGGPRYGIDFRGGALITVSFANRPPVDKVRAALSGKLPVDVQEVSGRPEDIIGIDAQQDAALQASRQKVIDSLDAAFGQPSNGKYNINSGGAAALADHLRDALAAASVATTDQQLQTLASNIMDYRKGHSGLIKSIDELASGLMVAAPAVAQAQQTT